jgi:hypothetical protein
MAALSFGGFSSFRFVSCLLTCDHVQQQHSILYWHICSLIHSINFAHAYTRTGDGDDDEDDETGEKRKKPAKSAAAAAASVMNQPLLKKRKSLLQVTVTSEFE